jgi:hypothetical protein
MDRNVKRLLDLLDSEHAETVGTSVRIPTSLRDAAVLAAGMGLGASTTELTVRGLRDALEAFAQRAVLDSHYRSHPHVRPDLAEVALATAEIDGSDLAGQPELVRQAAAQIGAVKDDPTPEDVLLYAAGLRAAVA